MPVKKEKYTLSFESLAKRQLKKLPRSIKKEVEVAINALSSNPRPNGYKKLKEYKGYRIKVRVYRIVYDILEKEVVISVIAVGHRKDIYEKICR